MPDVPAWLVTKQTEYQALKRKSAALHSSELSISVCQYLVVAGAVMAFGTLVFGVESPFYAGIGVTLIVIFGIRWWWMASELSAAARAQIQLADVIRASGFEIDWQGQIVAANDSPSDQQRSRARRK